MKLGILLLLVMLIPLVACQPAASDKPQRFPKLQLTGVDGTQTASSEWHGRWVILNIWATWCPPCRREMPSLQKLHQHSDPQQLAVIGLTVDDDNHLVREFLTQSGVTFRNFIDPDDIAADALAIQAYPQTLIIDPNGTIIRRIIGERDWNSPAVHHALQQAKQGNLSPLQQL